MRTTAANHVAPTKYSLPGLNLVMHLLHKGHLPELLHFRNANTFDDPLVKSGFKWFAPPY